MSHENSRELQANTPSKMNRRRFFQRGGFLAALATVATTFSLTPFAPAYAHPENDIKVEELKGIEAEHYIREATISPHYQQFHQRINQEHKETFSIIEHAAIALAISSSQVSMVVVRMPITGGLGYSGYAVTFQNGRVVQAQGSLFSYTQEHDIHIEMERDGQTILNAIVKQNGYIAQGTMRISNGSQMNLQGLTTKQIIPHAGPANPFQSICCIVGGLEQLAGISFAVGDLIAAACTVACAATAGVGCVACIAGIVLVSGGLIGTILGRCNYDVNSFGRCN